MLPLLFRRPLSRRYHPKCLKCSGCSRSLDSEARVSDDGVLRCEACRVRFLPSFLQWGLCLTPFRVFACRNPRLAGASVRPSPLSLEVSCLLFTLVPPSPCPPFSFFLSFRDQSTPESNLFIFRTLWTLVLVPDAAVPPPLFFLFLPSDLPLLLANPKYLALIPGFRDDTAWRVWPCYPPRLNGRSFGDSQRRWTDLATLDTLPSVSTCAPETSEGPSSFCFKRLRTSDRSLQLSGQVGTL